MNDGTGITKQVYRRDRIQRGRTALIISAISLAVSIVSLYEVAIKQARLSLYPSNSWRYSRLRDGKDEVVIIPVSVVNHGARPGIVRNFQLTIAKKGDEAKPFQSSGVVSPERTIQLFAPLTVQPHATTTTTLVFSALADPKDGPDATNDSPYVRSGGDFDATLTMCTAFERDYGFIDDLTKTGTETLSAALQISNVDVKFDNNLFSDRQAGIVQVANFAASQAKACSSE